MAGFSGRGVSTLWIIYYPLKSPLMPIKALCLSDDQLKIVADAILDYSAQNHHLLNGWSIGENHEADIEQLANLMEISYQTDVVREKIACLFH